MDEEILDAEDPMDEGMIPEAEEGISAGQYVADQGGRTKSDVFTLLLIFTFIAFLTGIIIAGNELYDFYDVQFWVFSKK